MKNTITKINFRHDGVIYTSEKEGYYYAQPIGGIKKRIAKDAFDKAYTAYVNGQVSDEEWQAQADAEKEQQEIAKQAKFAEDEKAVLGYNRPKLPEGYRIESLWDGDCTSFHLYKGDKKIAADWTAEPLYKVAQEDAAKATEEAQEQQTGEQPSEKKEAPKKAKKAPRKSKDIAYTYYDSDDVATRKAVLTLTAKQVDFIKHIPDTNFYEHGLDSILYCDILADEIGGQFAGKPMTTGAMISTLREKGLISVGIDRVNGRKCKIMSFTEMGMAVAMDMGLK